MLKAVELSVWNCHKLAQIHLTSDHTDSMLADLQARPECWTSKEKFRLLSQSHRPKQASKSKLLKTQKTND